MTPGELLKLIKQMLEENEDLKERILDIDIDPSDSHNLYVSLDNNGRYLNFEVRVDEF